MGGRQAQRESSATWLGCPIPKAAQSQVSCGQKRELLGQSTPMKTGQHTTWQ